MLCFLPPVVTFAVFAVLMLIQQGVTAQVITNLDRATLLAGEEIEITLSGLQSTPNSARATFGPSSSRDKYSSACTVK